MLDLNNCWFYLSKLVCKNYVFGAGRILIFAVRLDDLISNKLIDFIRLDSLACP
jgi:hypothetical protein